jgi:hypothetical protein
MRTDLPVLTPAPSQPRVNGAPSDTLESGAKLFIGVGGVLLLVALGSAVSEARFLARSATTDGVVRSGQPAGPRACVVAGRLALRPTASRASAGGPSAAS